MVDEDDGISKLESPKNTPTPAKAPASGGLPPVPPPANTPTVSTKTS